MYIPLCVGNLYICVIIMLIYTMLIYTYVDVYTTLRGQHQSLELWYIPDIYHDIYHGKP